MGFEIRRLNGPFGAEVLGLTEPRALARDDVQRLNRAWVNHVVLCLREQHVAPDGLLRLARLFGTPARQPLQRAEYQVPGYPELRVLSSEHVDTHGDKKPLYTGGSWHTDHSHLPEPPWGTMLHAIALPSRGGQTSFTDQTAAFAALSGEDKSRFEGLMGHHIYLSKYSKRRLQAMTAEERAAAPSARHPLVRRHDVTGRPALYFNPVRIEQFDGMTEAASQALLAQLTAHCEREQFVYRHSWQLGDVLIWDNRQALHKVAHDYPAGELRLMHRTLVGSTALAEAMRGGPET
ncbi:MAG: TauD/TfdA family dioxygenase [Gammaproteobacteria bacterium]|nr:TauD/TfdA family dioxygenase [Gammaproteobacteria bacterium]